MIVELSWIFESASGTSSQAFSRRERSWLSWYLAIWGMVQVSPSNSTDISSDLLVGLYLEGNLGLRRRFFKKGRLGSVRSLAKGSRQKEVFSEGVGKNLIQKVFFHTHFGIDVGTKFS